jgi:signal transduction histidine kinase
MSEASIHHTPDNRRLRLLLIEDQRADAELLLAEIDRLGYTVECERVETRDQMDAALDLDWDLIISDFSLPQFGASGALELCAQRKIGIPFIIVSGTIAEEEAVESMRLGASDFITKGRLARLGPAIIRSLREREERRARTVAELRLIQAQKMEAIGQLAGGVAHDFNNLLGVIMGFGELLLKSLPEGDRQHERADQIVRAGARAAALTRQLLAFSRQQPMEARVVELAAAVKPVETMLSRLIGENIEITVLDDGSHGRVRVDPTQIEQVVMNLAINGRDAMSDGGSLVIETANVDLDAGYARSHPDVEPGPYVLLSVSDTGSGMDTDTLSHIFEPFFTTKEPGRGTGLGLATVYGIVRQSGGHLAVYSEVGRGTTFKLYLPRVESAASEGAGAAAARTAGGGQETVLLVEDEPALREVIAEQLGSGGYEVVTGHDVKAALAAADAHPGPIHLVITDLVMPIMSGPDVVRQLRARRPELRVIYMSGYSSAAVGLHSLVDSEEPFLAKPFTLAALLDKVREVLGG